MASLIQEEHSLIGVVALLIEEAVYLYEEDTSQIKEDSSFIEDAASLSAATVFERQSPQQRRQPQ